MLYGLLIGFIINAIIILFNNPPEYSQLSEATAITRQVVRVVTLMTLITSSCALAGLIIQDL